MKKLVSALVLFLIIAIVISFSVSEDSGAQNNNLLDRSFYEEVGVLVYVGPAWSVANQLPYASQTTTDLYGKPSRYTWRLIHGAWRWKNGIEITPFRTYSVIPTMQDAQTVVALANNLTYSSTVAWNPQTGFAIPTGSLGLRNPRVELVIWYNDGSLRHVLISQTETINGGMYALVFDHIASRDAPHPMGLYVLDQTSAKALIDFVATFVE